MKKLFLLFALFAICYNDSVDLCSQSFDTDKKTACETIKFDDTHYCIYSDGQCKIGYKECADYASDNNFDNKTCTDIIPSNKMYKCKVNIDTSNNNKKTCIQELKPCSEYPNIGGNCINLKAEEGYRCVLYNGKCEAHKDECTDLSQDKCGNNIPKDYQKMCKWDTSGSTGQCTSEDRTCARHIIFEDKNGRSLLNNCLNLKATDNKKTCYLNGEKCEEYFEDCTQGDRTTCGTIKPLNSGKNGFEDLYECRYTTSCEKKLKMCENYSGNNINDNICIQLDVTDSDNKICRIDISSLKCKEYYKTCTSINSKEDTIINKGCIDINPRDENKNYVIDPHSECFINEENKCDIRKKECKDIMAEDLCNAHILDNKRCLYKERSCIEIYKTCNDYNEDDSSTKKQEDCTNSFYSQDPTYSECFINASKDNICDNRKKDCSKLDSTLCNGQTLDNDKKRCFYQGNACKEMYKTCNDYNEDTENKSKSEDDCKNIVLSDSYLECFINAEKENKCDTRKKECSKLSENLCESQELDNIHKICIYKDNSCIEKYKTCDDYNDDTETEKNQAKCTEIEPFRKKDNFIYKCNYKDNTCTEKKMICGEDYTGDDSRLCNYLTDNLETSDKDKYYCGIDKEGKCAKLYKDCEKYDGSDSNICKSIQASNYLYKCEIDSKDDNKCKQKIKICSDYKEEDKYDCTEYAHSSGIKTTDNQADIVYTCELDSNKKCVDKIIYNKCTAYEGNDVKICNAIQPLNDFNKKCIISEGHCIETQKTCEDAIFDSNCPNIIPVTENKECVYDYKNKKCIEQYKTCENYNTNVDQTICESMIKPSTQKCKYNAPTTSGETATCTTVDATCSDFKPELIAGQCSYNLNDNTKYCSYENNDCIQKSYTCLEMSSIPRLQEDDCSNAKTSSSNKLCALKSDGSGCEEKDNNTKNNSAVKNNLAVIFLICLCLLF